MSVLRRLEESVRSTILKDRKTPKELVISREDMNELAIELTNMDCYQSLPGSLYPMGELKLFKPTIDQIMSGPIVVIGVPVMVQHVTN